MNLRGFSFFLFGLVNLMITTNCAPKPSVYTCGNDPIFLPEFGSKSNVSYTEFSTNDTNSCAIFGSIHSLKYDEPLFAANVMLKDNNHTYGLVSDLEGKFEFKNIKPGTYSLSARYYDHLSLNFDSITLSKGKDYNLVIQLGFKGRNDFENK